MPLLSDAIELLSECLDSSDTIRWLGEVSTGRVQKDLRLYHQDLRGLVRLFDDRALEAIQEADPDAAARILAYAGDAIRAIEERDVTSASVAMVYVGGLLATNAHVVGIRAPSTVFVAQPTAPLTEEAAPPRPSRWRELLRKSVDLTCLPFDLIRLLWMPRKGRPFLFDSPDDPSRPDRYAAGEPFGRRVFVSFERSSEAIADRLEAALNELGLEPYRYQPSKPLTLGKPRYSTAEFRRQNPGVGEEIVRTVRRSSAVVLIVSEAWMRSPVCELEAFAAKICFFPFSSGLFAFMESPRARFPEWLRDVQKRTYRPGAETALAEEIARDIDALADLRAAAEERRRAPSDDRAREG